MLTALLVVIITAAVALVLLVGVPAAADIVRRRRRHLYVRRLRATTAESERNIARIVQAAQLEMLRLMVESRRR